MTDIEERSTGNGDDRSLIERQLLGRASVTREFRSSPIENVSRIEHLFRFARTSTTTIPGQF
jgi:hypothetical protein